jgi:uncharacterized damage-inducible protein DinB
MSTGVSADTFRRWYAYERDVHASVVSSLESVPPELQDLEGYHKAVGLLAHIATARRLWLFRLGVLSTGPADLFPAVDSLEDATALLDEAQAEWSAYIGGLTDVELARHFDYTSLDGGRFRNTIEEILTQLFGHSWYHRGQIAQLLRSIGAEPAVTDFVFWSRTSLDRS